MNSERAVGAEEPDPKEFFHWYRGGKHPLSCLESTSQIFEALANVAVKLFSDLSFEIPSLRQFTGDIARSERLVLRIARYEGKSLDLLNAPHEDIDFITVLPKATDPGLEVMENGEWKPAAAALGQCVILSGDMLAEATNGRIKAVRHRVMAKAAERLSMSFFMNPDDGVQLSPQWKASDLLMYRLREIGIVA